MQWEKSDMTLPKFVRAQLRRKNIALLTHNEKHVGQIRIITIPKHIHSNYFPLIFWVISNDILTTTNITITQKHCRDDIFQKPTWITYFRSTLKKKNNFMNFQSNPYFKHSLTFSTGISGLFCLWDLIC